MSKSQQVDSVCALIICYNGSAVISETINALKLQVDKIVVIDNNSDDITLGILSDLSSDKVIVIYNHSNYGVAHALNQGVMFAIESNFGWVLTMDQDSIADPSMVTDLLNCAKFFGNSPKVVSFSPMLSTYSCKTTGKGRDSFEERYTVITSGNLVRTSVFTEIGLFDEKLFIDSVDFEFCLRLKKFGYKIIRCHNAFLNHSLGVQKQINFLGSLVTITVHPAVRKYYIARNHLYITKRFFLKFPLYCIWKQVAMIRLLLQIFFWEDNRLDGLRHVVLGLVDGICCNYGKLKE